MTNDFSRLLAKSKRPIDTTFKILISFLVLEFILVGISFSESKKRIIIGSGAFTLSGSIPQPYTCIGADRSPPLFWSTAPPEARSLVLLVQDPDAPSGVFTHWIVYNLPSVATGLPEDASRLGGWLTGKQGRNDFGRIGYNGPCPPPGGPHHYHFRLFALDRILRFDSAPNAAAMLPAIRGHVIAEGETTGLFNR